MCTVGDVMGTDEPQVSSSSFPSISPTGSNAKADSGSGSVAGHYDESSLLVRNNIKQTINWKFKTTWNKEQFISSILLLELEHIFFRKIGRSPTLNVTQCGKFESNCSFVLFMGYFIIRKYIKLMK